MKNKFISMALIAIVIGTTANAQNSASTDVTATATIITPISISKGSDLSFGSIVKSSQPGTVVLAVDAPLSTTGGVTMFSGTGSRISTPALAEFTIAGEDGNGYIVSLPGDNVVVLNDGNGNSMNLTGFHSNATGVFTSGTETFKVGATLHVEANQVSGVYTSDAFKVTVAYN